MLTVTEIKNLTKTEQAALRSRPFLPSKVWITAVKGMKRVPNPAAAERWCEAACSIARGKRWPRATRRIS